MLLKDASLTPETLAVIRHQATEKPFTGIFNNMISNGTYLCRGCGLALFHANMKFQSSCGWPSFDDSITDGVIEKADADGLRTEILCKRCQAHLGHVFIGEGLTAKNKRYCVNSISMDFVAHPDVFDTEEIIVAGGCFWGLDYFFENLKGVVKTEVGYTGGIKVYPKYEEVCSGTTGHYEAIRVIYDLNLLSYEKILKYFFEIHDPTQADGQGPDRGKQYQSAVFYYNDIQKKIAESLIQTLKTKGYNVASKLLPAQVFWAAEEIHQRYYIKRGQRAVCHRFTKRFED